MTHYEHGRRPVPAALPITTFTIPALNPMGSKRRQAPPPPLSSISQVESITDFTTRSYGGTEERKVPKKDSFENMYNYAGSPPPNKLTYERKELPTPPSGLATPDLLHAPRRKKSKDMNVLIQETGGKIITEGMESPRNKDTLAADIIARKKKNGKGKISRHGSRDVTAEMDEAYYGASSPRTGESRRSRRNSENGERRKGRQNNKTEIPEAAMRSPKEDLIEYSQEGPRPFSTSLEGNTNRPPRKQTPFRQPPAALAAVPPPPELPPLSPLPSTAYVPFEALARSEDHNSALAHPITIPADMRPPEQHHRFKLAPAPSRSPVKKNTKYTEPGLKSHSSNVSATSIEIPFFMAEHNSTAGDISGSSRIPAAISEHPEDYLHNKGSVPEEHAATTKPTALRVTNRPTPISIAEHRRTGSSRDQDLSAQSDNELALEELALELEVHENPNGDIHLLPSPRNLSPRGQNSPMSMSALYQQSPNSLNVPSPYAPPKSMAAVYEGGIPKHKRSNSVNSASSDSTSSSILRDAVMSENGRRNKPMVDTPLTDYSGMMTPAFVPVSASGGKFKVSKQSHLEVKSPKTDLRPISSCSNGSIFDSYYGDTGTGGEVNMALQLSEEERITHDNHEDYGANCNEWNEGDVQTPNSGVSEWQLEWDRITQGQRSTGKSKGNAHGSTLDLQLTPPGIVRPQRSIDVFGSPTETPRWVLEDELKQEIESENQRHANLAGFNSAANVSQRPAIDEWLMNSEPPMTPMTPVELGIGRVGVVVDRRTAKTDDDRKTADEKRVTAWPSFTIVEEEEDGDVPIVAMRNPADHHDVYMGPPAPPPPPPPSLSPVLSHDAYTGPPVPPPPPVLSQDVYTGPPVPPPPVLSHDVYTGPPVPPPPPVLSHDMYTGPPVPPSPPPAPVVATALSHDAYTGPPVPPPPPQALSMPPPANTGRVQRSATSPIRPSYDNPKVSRSRSIKELIFTLGKSGSTPAPYNEEAASPTSSSPTVTSGNGFNGAIARSPTTATNAMGSPTREETIARATPSPAFPSPAFYSPASPSPSVLFSRSTSIRKQSITKEDISRPIAPGQEFGTTRSLGSIKEQSTIRMMSSPAPEPHKRAGSVSGGSLRSIAPHMISLPLTPGTPGTPGTYRTMQSNDSYAMITNSALTPTTPHSPPFPQSIKSPVSERGSPPLPPPPPPPPLDPSQIPVAQGATVEEFQYPRPLEVFPPKPRPEVPPAAPAPPLKRFASLSLRRTLSLGFKSSKANGSVSRSTSSASIRGRFGRSQAEPQAQASAEPRERGTASPAFGQPGIKEEECISPLDDPEARAAELKRREKERKVSPGTLVIQPNSGEPIALRMGKDIGHRLKPKRVEDRLLSAPKVDGIKEGACTSCKRGPFPTMWICADIFYDDEEEGGTCDHGSDGMKTSEPGTGRSYCHYSLCRMCANEKINSGLAILD